jgi:hypothetical protein
VCPALRRRSDEAAIRSRVSVRVTSFRQSCLSPPAPTCHRPVGQLCDGGPSSTADRALVRRPSVAECLLARAHPPWLPRLRSWTDGSPLRRRCTEPRGRPSRTYRARCSGSMTSWRVLSAAREGPDFAARSCFRGRAFDRCCGVPSTGACAITDHYRRTGRRELLTAEIGPDANPSADAWLDDQGANDFLAPSGDRSCWSRLRPRVCGTNGSGLVTRDDPQTAPEKGDTWRRGQGSTVLSHLQVPTHTSRVPCSGAMEKDGGRLKSLSSDAGVTNATTRYPRRSPTTTEVGTGTLRCKNPAPWQL